MITTEEKCLHELDKVFQGRDDHSVGDLVVEYEQIKCQTNFWVGTRITSSAILGLDYY